MEKIFSVKLKKQLQERIKGDISVHIIDDTLIIDINPFGLCPWFYTIKNIAEQMATGLSSRNVADVIVKQYKKHIISQHFYSK